MVDTSTLSGINQASGFTSTDPITDNPSVGHPTAVGNDNSNPVNRSGSTDTSTLSGIDALSTQSTTEERLRNAPTGLDQFTSLPGSGHPVSFASNTGIPVFGNNHGVVGPVFLQAANNVNTDPTNHPDTLAQEIIDANTITRNSRGGGQTTRVSVTGVAADVVHLGRTHDQALSGAVYGAVQNHDSINKTELEAAVNEQLTQEHVADLRLLGDSAAEPVIPEAGAAAADVLLDAHTHTRTTGRGRWTNTTTDINSLAYDIEQLAQQNPSLAVATRLDIASRLDADQASQLNRIISGNATIGENIEIAVENPGDGFVGALKGIGNGVLALGELFVKGSTAQAAAEQQQAAGISALMGNDELAEQQMQLGDELMDAALNEDFVPEFSIDNRAQQGGETIGFAIDIALAGKGIITGGAKLLARNADELLEVGARSLDEVGSTGNATDNVLRLGDDVITNNRIYEHTQVGGRSAITDGTYTTNPTGMARHAPGTAPPGRSVFRSDVDAELATLDAARYADEHNLWNAQNKAKVPVTNGPVGYLGDGTPTSIINVYRNSNGMIHGSPGR